MADLIDVTTRRCCVCGRGGSLLVDAEAYGRWRLPRSEGGLLAQEAFPDLSPADREQLISGTHPECWEALFSSVPEGERESE